ncbi:unnamed protein product [Brassicogethes aeneus]|uniref:DNA repair protein REV1 n=1 Tax=Brassicogethes aeneus TaxID=1431903 RepID=A0A9P0AWD0_BRAAE|nr:unnamed protein product [Brassicogethes aeneus]
MGRRKKDFNTSDGFEEWGGYKKAKVSKLDEQFKDESKIVKISDIFQGVAIMVNGITRPPADELKKLMAQHGGVYHMYQLSSTTHIICSNLPTVKIRNMGTKPVVKPAWITESISLGKIIDFRRYLLYTHQSISQPRLDFKVIDKPSTSMNQSTTNISPEKSTKICVESEVKSPKKIEVTSRSTKTASDPNFLEEFYNNSRLHLISTLGAEYKQLVCQIRDKHDGFFLGRKKLAATRGNTTNMQQENRETVIMHIDMDCFFVSVGLKSRPDLIGKPVAIAHARTARTANDNTENRSLEFAMYEERNGNIAAGASRVANLDGRASMSEIASCSYEARKCGVKNGMFLGRAAQLCPDLITLPYDFEGYKEVSNLLYQTIASYTVDIEAVSCDEMYVDCTEILRETGLSVSEWATHVRGEITAITGCPCSTGFGANRLQARLATRKAKPNGQFHLKADIVEDYMSDIPLSDLPGVGRATLAKLANLGLTTCGDVQISSLKCLQSELGAKVGETLVDQAKGIDKKPLNYYQERKSISAEINYGIRFKSLEEFWSFLQTLSHEVYNRLLDTGMRSRCLTLKLMVRAATAPVETAKFLGHGICDNLSKTTSSNQIIGSADVVFNEAKVLYEKLNAPFCDLRGVGIQLTKLEKPGNVDNALGKFLVKKSEEAGRKIRGKVR